MCPKDTHNAMQSVTPSSASYSGSVVGEATENKRAQVHDVLRRCATDRRLDATEQCWVSAGLSGNVKPRPETSSITYAFMYTRQQYNAMLI